MQAPQFIIHAAGSRGNVPDFGKKAYRLKFSVITGPSPSREAVKYGLRQSFGELERQLKQRGFVFVGERTVRYEETVPHVECVDIRVPRRLSSKQMLPGVMQGAKYRAEDEPVAMTVPLLEETDAWEHIFSGLFVHDTLMADLPDPHEVIRS